ncbi:ABC transporter substrate-binding protein [Pseudodesulfovibrio cashew]|uniref:ABC transporter substrate-binding protein n=1 Tax=Pseudodesulfovibrio cashew TaxID=2678688 RepID=A0A6I6JJ01_9BACT|nr:helical backbone metal receptor [Pseudodesulfovibrio cashew]QGY40292.1 ABC transporter substrate-binding protein [Pseudodesulfovibrio cashew]
MKGRLGKTLGCLALLAALALPCDSRGETTRAARRIVSLAPSVTEILYAMGVGKRVVGTTEHSDYPAEAAGLPTVGQYMSPELERIVALRPDLCVGLSEATSPRLVEALARLGIPMFLTNASRLDRMLDSIGELGAFLGVEEQALRLKRQYSERLESIRRFGNKAGHPRVLTIISVSPLYAAGPGSFIADMVRCAGGNPLGLDDGKAWQGLSREAVIWLKPDIILFAAHSGSIPEWMRQYPLDSAEVVAIDPSLVIRPSPRLIDTAGFLAREFHRLSAEPTTPNE